MALSAETTKQSVSVSSGGAYSLLAALKSSSSANDEDSTLFSSMLSDSETSRRAKPDPSSADPTEKTDTAPTQEWRDAAWAETRSQNQEQADAAEGPDEGTEARATVVSAPPAQAADVSVDAEVEPAVQAAPEPVSLSDAQGLANSQDQAPVLSVQTQDAAVEIPVVLSGTEEVPVVSPSADGGVALPPVQTPVVPVVSLQGVPEPIAAQPVVLPLNGSAPSALQSVAPVIPTDALATPVPDSTQQVLPPAAVSAAPVVALPLSDGDTECVIDNSVSDLVQAPLSDEEAAAAADDEALMAFWSSIQASQSQQKPSKGTGDTNDLTLTCIVSEARVDDVSEDDLTAELAALMGLTPACLPMPETSGGLKTTAGASASVLVPGSEDQGALVPLMGALIAPLQAQAPGSTGQADEASSDEDLDSAFAALIAAASDDSSSSDLLAALGETKAKTNSDSLTAMLASQAHVTASSKSEAQEQVQAVQSALSQTLLQTAATQTVAAQVSASATSDVPSEDISGTPASSAGSSSGSSSVVVGDGGRTAGSYSFASQLSAAGGDKSPATTATQMIDQVAVSVRKMVKAGDNEMTIQLHPSDLGKIEVKLTFGEDNKVTGTVVADKASTLQTLQKDSGALHRALNDAGLQTDAGSLQFSMREDSQGSSYSQSQSGTQNASSNTALSDLQETADETLLGEAVETYYITPERVNLRV